MVSTQNKPASTPAPGRMTTATVLSSHFKDGATVPNFIEVEGRIYTGDRDQAELREILESSRLHDIIIRVGKEVTQAYNRLWALDQDSHEKRCLAALRAVGRFLVDQREYGLLKTLYLTLRERDETTDTVMNTIRHDDYQANDEYLFFLGEKWESYLESLARNEKGDAEAEAEASHHQAGSGGTRVSTYERIDSDDAERQVWRLESTIRGMVQPHALPGVDAALSELDHQQQLRGLSYEENAWHAVGAYLVEHGHGAVYAREEPRWESKEEPRRFRPGARGRPRGWSAPRWAASWRAPSGASAGTRGLATPRR